MKVHHVWYSNLIILPDKLSADVKKLQNIITQKYVVNNMYNINFVNHLCLPQINSNQIQTKDTKNWIDKFYYKN